MKFVRLNRYKLCILMHFIIGKRNYVNVNSIEEDFVKEIVNNG